MTTENDGVLEVRVFLKGLEQLSRAHAPATEAPVLDGGDTKPLKPQRGPSVPMA
jgi:hypothetical protein